MTVSTFLPSAVGTSTMLSSISMTMGVETKVEGATGLSGTCPLPCGNEAEGLTERWSFEAVTFLGGYFLPRLLDEGFEPMGPSIILAPTPASGVPIRASPPVLPSPKLVRNEGGTPTPVAAKNQQLKFML